MNRKIIITEEEKQNIKSQYNITEQSIIGTALSDLSKYFKNPSVVAKPKVHPDDSKLPNKTTPDDDIYKGILHCVGAKPTKHNMLFMYAWRQTEHGLYEKKIAAKNNPFNTTQPMPGATILKDSTAGVKNYKKPEDGIKATCETLTNGKYDKIVDGLKKDIGLLKLKNAVATSPWGTDGDLLTTITKGYYAGNEPKPGPIPRT
jgi:hypothetical protein